MISVALIKSASAKLQQLRSVPRTAWRFKDATPESNNSWKVSDADVFLDSSNLGYTKALNKYQMQLHSSGYFFSFWFFINIVDQWINNDSINYLYVTFRNFAELNISLTSDIRPTTENGKTKDAFILITYVRIYFISLYEFEL